MCIAPLEIGASTKAVISNILLSMHPVVLLGRHQQYIDTHPVQ